MSVGTTIDRFQSHFRGDPGLPPGVRQTDIDGPRDEARQSAGDWLYELPPADFQQIIERFFSDHGDVIADDVLDHRVTDATLGRKLRERFAAMVESERGKL